MGDENKGLRKICMLALAMGESPDSFIDRLQSKAKERNKRLEGIPEGHYRVLEAPRDDYTPLDFPNIEEARDYIGGQKVVQQGERIYYAIWDSSKKYIEGPI